MKKSRSLSRFLAWLFAIISFVLILALTCSIFVILRLQKNNLFSKHILLDNNYFMDRHVYDVDTSGTDENGSDKDQLCEIPGDADDGADPEIIIQNDMLYIQMEDEATAVVDKFFKLYGDKIGVPYSEIPHVKEEVFREIRSIYHMFGITEEADREVHAYLKKYFEIDFTFPFRSLFKLERICIDVPYISQAGEFPNGCEAVSATMLLQFYGFEIDAGTFIDNYLDCEPISVRFGCKYGPNPRYFYAGDPRSESDGLGCFAPVIAKAMNKYLPEGYMATNTTGMSLNTLKERYVKNGVPVLIWGTIKMNEVERILQWQSYDHKETFLYPANEHCMVFVGYDEENYIFNDPYNSNGVISYPKDDCVLAFNSLGAQSVIIEKTQ